MNLRLCLSFVAALVSICVDAQTVATGRIVCDGQPVPFATVSFSADSLCRAVSGYALTGEDGSYKARLKSSGNQWQTVRCLGFQTHLSKVSLADGVNDLGATEITKDVLELTDVTIKASAIGRTMRGDTVVFNPQVFATGAESSLADVLRRLPGIDVDETGNASYMGRPISKILVNGRDVLARGGATLNTLPADYANGIEIITDYRDGSVSDDFETTRKTALNIKSDESRKHFGNIDASGGLRRKFDARGTMMRLDDRLSLTVMANANNTGAALFSFTDYVNSLGGLSSLSTGSRLVAVSLSDPGIASLIRPSSDEYKRPACLLNATATWKPGKRYKLLLSVLGNYLESSAMTQTEQYFASGTVNTSSEASERDNTMLRLTATQRFDVSPTFDIRAETAVGYGDYGRRNVFVDTELCAPTMARDRHSTDELMLRQQLAVNCRTDFGLIYADATVDYQDGCRGLRIADERNLIGVQVDAQGVLTSKADRTKTNLRGTAGLMLPLVDDDLSLKVEVGQRFARTRRHSVFGAQSGTETHDASRFNLYGALARSQGPLTFEFGCAAALHSIAFTGLADAHVWRAEPYATFYLEVDGKGANVLSLTVKRSHASPNDSELTRFATAESYSSVVQASVTDCRPWARWQGEMSYNLIRGRTTLNLSADFDRGSRKPLISSDSDGILSISRYAGRGRIESYSANLGLEQGLSQLPIDISFEATCEISSTAMCYSGTNVTVETVEPNAEIGFSTRFMSFPVNFGIDFGYVYEESRIKCLDKSAYGHNPYGEAELTFARGRWRGKAKYLYDKIRNDETSLTHSDIDLMIACRIGPAELRISGENLLNLGGLEWLSKTMTPVMCSYSRYKQIGGHLLFGISVKL